MKGIGNAWAWHNNAKLSFAFCTKNVPFDENVGARDPTGSVTINYFTIKEKIFN